MVALAAPFYLVISITLVERSNHEEGTCTGRFCLAIYPKSLSRPSLSLSRKLAAS